MKGTPQTMQVNPHFEDVVSDVYSFLQTKSEILKGVGLTDVILDPGFGFGKTRAHNYQLLQRLTEFRALDRPLLVGLSRKSMIWKTLNITAQSALNGTTALHMVALSKGANILRVHDVAPARECIKLFLELREAAHTSSTSA